MAGCPLGCAFPASPASFGYAAPTCLIELTYVLRETDGSEADRG